MRKFQCLQFLIVLLGFISGAHAQLGGAGGSQESPKAPIEIYSDGGTRFEAGLAVSENNVVIYYGGSRIYADYAQYNPETHDVLLKGHVKIYEQTHIFSGETAFYNLDTKTMRSSDFLGDQAAFHFQGDTLYSIENGAYQIKNGYFTTHDSSKPDYRLRARSVRIYPDNRIIFSNVTLLIGQTPVFWWPYLYQSLNELNSFLISPGYSSKLGAYVLTSFAFPISETTLGRLHLDYLSERGPATGLDIEYKSGKESTLDPQSYSTIRSYILNDSATEIDKTTLGRPVIDSTRYRLSWQSKLYFSEDWTSTIDINKLSDSKFLEDFYPSENRLDPQPDTVAALTKAGSNWTFTAMARKQINDFQPTTERLPELDLDYVRSRFFGSPVYYEGESSLSFLNKAFANNSAVKDFGTFRADTFHQFTYPNTYFGWLSVIPRAGFRLTYYNKTGTRSRGLSQSGIDTVDQQQIGISNREALISDAQQQIADLNAQLSVASPEQAGTIRDQISFLQAQTALNQNINSQQTAYINNLRSNGDVDVINGSGAKLRTVFNFGVESSFKVSRTYDDVQYRWAGLDGLKHIIQPYVNLSYVVGPSVNPDHLLPIDTYIPSTQLAPFDFPQAVALDSINEASVLRLGTRNRLLTKRDDQSFAWLELDTFFNVNFENPYDSSQFSNLFNRLRFSPVPWVAFAIDSQLPLFDEGFTEVNTSLTFMPTRDLTMSVSHRYLDKNPFFADSSLVSLGTYYQIDSNWGVGINEQYELNDSVLESQRYTVYRDLTSWIASLSAVVRDNRGKDDIGVFLTFTLKELPNLNLDFKFDPSSSGQDN